MGSCNLQLWNFSDNSSNTYIISLAFFIQVAETENWREKSVFASERSYIGTYKSEISDLVSVHSLAKLNEVDKPQEKWKA